MASNGSGNDPRGQQPEFVKGLEAAAQADGKKPAGQSTTATAKTAPQSASLAEEEGKAAGILHRNAIRDTGAPSR